MSTMKPAIDFSDPETVEEAAKRIEALRAELLGNGDLSGAGVMAEPHFLIAMSLLEQAAQNLKLASCLIP